jgi:hypothetical protein
MLSLRQGTALMIRCFEDRGDDSGELFCVSLRLKQLQKLHDICRFYN